MNYGTKLLVLVLLFLLTTPYSKAHTLKRPVDVKNARESSLTCAVQTGKINVTVKADRAHNGKNENLQVDSVLSCGRCWDPKKECRCELITASFPPNDVKIGIGCVMTWSSKLPVMNPSETY